MNKYLRYLLPILCVTVLAGCATEAKYNAMIQTWNGQSAEKLVDVWGYPDRIFKAPNGNEVYSYENADNVYIPETTNYTGSGHIVNNHVYGSGYAYSSGGYSVNLICKTYFELDKKKIVVRSTFKGNDCKSNYSPE